MNEISLKNLILPISNIAIGAGLLINKFYLSSLKISLKDDKSPLTEADLSSNKFIINSLLKLNSNIPILSEESLVPWNIRKNWVKYWLVDPLDGTKEFINQNDEFTVNIALIENNEPILGVIYAPALSILYYAIKNNGSYKLTTFQKNSSLFESTKIQTTKKKISDNLSVVCSRSNTNENFVNSLNINIENYNIIKKGSSLKFCDIAEGKADYYPRFSPSCEWDIAAGHIILIEAGGDLKTLDKKNILYNTKDSVINPHFIASCNLIKVRDNL